MARTTRQVFECVCDRCKKEGDTENEKGTQEFGGVTIKYNGHVSGRTWQGDAAGVVHKGEKWLCLDCTKAFVAFMSNPTNGTSA